MTTIDSTGNVHRAAGAPGGGQFTGRVNQRPVETLQPAAQGLEDPWGEMRPYPVPADVQERIAEANTFAEIDAAYRQSATPGAEYMRELEARWGAVERGRELRRTGVAEGVPTSLTTTGWAANPFAHAQNDVELRDMYALATEEPPGDGEASTIAVNRWMRSVNEKFNDRRRELIRAGVVEAAS